MNICFWLLPRKQSFFIHGSFAANFDFQVFLELSEDDFDYKWWNSKVFPDNHVKQMSKIEPLPKPSNFIVSKMLISDSSELRIADIQQR